nr:ATP-binding cassette domain-containing protein [Ilumatobacteraceae bacterium]
VELVGVIVRRGGRTALDGVHLRVGAGDLVVVIGESGSGTTALLRAIAGVDVPDAGAVRFGGVDVSHSSPRERRASLLVDASRAWIDEVVVEHRPQVLLLDRPRRLDDLPSLRTTAGVTMLVASTDPVALAIADWVVVLRAGEVVQIGLASEVVDDPVDVGVARLTGPIELEPARVEADPPGAWLVTASGRERVWAPAVVARAASEVLVAHRGGRLLVFDPATGRRVR